MNLPQGHQTVMPYLIMDSAEEFIDFTISVFNAIEKTRVPSPEGGIMHAEIMIGMSTLMFAGATTQFEPDTANLFVYVEDVDATYQRALKAGAISIRAPRQEDYGYSAGIEDPFGNTWWMSAPSTAQ
jgi:PhnB protein